MGHTFSLFFIVLFLIFTLLLQTVSHLKVLLHILVGGILGGLFLDDGNNGSRTVSNLGYLFICVVYLSYTTLLPAVIRCKFWLMGLNFTNLGWLFVAVYKLMNQFKH